MVAPRGRESAGDRAQLGKMKRGLELDGGDGRTTVWMYLLPLNRRLKNAKDGKFYTFILGVFYPNKKKKMEKIFPNTGSLEGTGKFRGEG